MLFGFADSRGGAALNQRLSEHRARFVRDALATYGLAPGVVEGFGTALGAEPPGGGVGAALIAGDGLIARAA